MSTDERTPLLTKPLPSLPTLIPAPQPTRPSSPYSHIVASLAAVRAGKLPTTRQAESILKALLDSPLFGDDDDGRKLSKRGDNVRSATREVLEAIGEVLKRCEGDSWQHVFWEWRGVDVSVEKPSLPTPSAAETTQPAKQAFQSLILTTLTSAPFRALMTDFLILAKDIFVATTADNIPATAEKVDAVVSDFASSQPHSKEGAPMSTDDLFTRLGEIMTRVQQTPSYRSSIETLFSIVQQYTTSLSSTLTPTASIKPHKPSPYLRPALEPFTGDLSPLLRALSVLQSRLEKPPEEFAVMLLEVETFFTAFLLEPEWKETEQCQKQWENLKRDIHLPSLLPIRESFVTVLSELMAVLDKVGKDEDLQRVIQKVAVLAGATEKWGGSFVMRGGLGWADVIDFILPRVLAFVKEIPLPRIEFASPPLGLNLALDLPPFLAFSLLPDLITLHNASTLYFPSTPSPSSNATSVSSLTTSREPYSTRTKIKLEGVRLAIRDVGYSAKWFGVQFCGANLGVSHEEGLCDFVIGDEISAKRERGTKEGSGLEVEIEVGVPNVLDGQRGGKAFDVLEAKANASNVTIRLHESHHWIATGLLGPVASYVVRQQMGKVVEGKVKEGLEWLAGIAGEVRDAREVGAEEEEEGAVMGWVKAIWRVYAKRKAVTERERAEQEELESDDAEPELEEVSEGASDEEEEAAPPAVHVSGKGVTVDLGIGTVGVGGSGVVIPDGEAETPIPRPTIGEIVDHQVGETIEEGKEAVQIVSEIGEAVGEFQDDLVAERRSKKRVGWRGKAFD